MSTEEPAFKIKTGNFTLLQLHVNTGDMDALRHQLAERLSQTPDFFASTPIVLELSALAGSDVVPDLAGLVSYMRERGMCPAGVSGGSAGQRAAAIQAGLGLFPDTPARNVPKREPEQPPPVHVELHEQPELPGFEAEPQAQPAAPVLTPVRPTLVIDKPVRTGQRIYAEGASLVVLAIVNAGAELIADGDIHVYAPMRGRAIAGAHGNEAARIFLHGIEAELLSIAGCFKVYEDGVPENVRGKPVQVHLEGSRLVIAPLQY